MSRANGRESHITTWGLELETSFCDPASPEALSSYLVTFKDQIIGVVWSLKTPGGVRWASKLDAIVADGRELGNRMTREIALDSLLEAYMASLSRDYRNMDATKRAELILPSPRIARERAFRKLCKELGGGAEGNIFATNVRRHKAAIGKWLAADADIDERVKNGEISRGIERTKKNDEP